MTRQPYEPDVTAYEALVEEFLSAASQDDRYAVEMCRRAVVIENRRNAGAQRRARNRGDS